MIGAKMLENVGLTFFLAWAVFSIVSIIKAMSEDIDGIWQKLAFWNFLIFSAFCIIFIVSMFLYLIWRN